MADIKARVVLDGEQNFKSGIKSINTELKTMQSEVKAVEAEIKSQGASVEKMKYCAWLGLTLTKVNTSGWRK